MTKKEFIENLKEVKKDVKNLEQDTFLDEEKKQI